MAEGSFREGSDPFYIFGHDMGSFCPAQGSVSWKILDKEGKKGYLERAKGVLRWIEPFEKSLQTSSPTSSILREWGSKVCQYQNERPENIEAIRPLMQGLAQR